MGSKTFDGVWFIAYSDDHLPEHIHGFYAETEVILELVFAERKIRLARKAKPLNAKKSDVKRICSRSEPVHGRTHQVMGGCTTMSEWVVDITDEDIDAAVEAAKDLTPRPTALSAEYNRALDLVILHIDNGQRLVIPREQLQGLEDATESQLAQVEVKFGVDIGWPQLDVNHYLPYLLEGKYSTEKWKKARERRAVAA